MLRKLNRNLENQLTKQVNKLIPKPKLPKLIVGWQEWCSFPKLHLPAIKAKIDTGAKTSALHAWDIHTFQRHGELHIRFTVHPLQRDNLVSRDCTAKVVDQRTVISSNGHREHRYVIRTPVIVGELTFDMDITLTNRDDMTFRMLLGRDALKGRAIVDPAKALRQGRLSKRELRGLYTLE
jgi:ribosomal protein S6--L-glutamate ligase